MARSESTLDTPAEPPEVLNATRARQGSRGRHIFWVLVISLALAAAALFGSLAFHEGDISGRGGQQTSPAAATEFDTVPGANQTAPTAPSAP